MSIILQVQHKMLEFKTNDSTTPEFYNERFDASYTPWDQKGVPKAFAEFVERTETPKITFIPGCGLGHEVALLGESGWDVTAIDYSIGGVLAARKNLGEKWGKFVFEGDFFSFTPSRPPQLIYERAFFCSFPPRMREKVVARWAELLLPGGLLVGSFFQGEKEGGPPFAITAECFKALMETTFELVEDCPTIDWIPPFEGKERWQIWKRRWVLLLPIFCNCI